MIKLTGRNATKRQQNTQKADIFSGVIIRELQFRYYCREELLGHERNMEDLELDVRQYTPVELRAFFGLDPVKTYSVTHIESRAYAIREQFYGLGDHRAH
jgi:hypothetical protein